MTAKKLHTVLVLLLSVLTPGCMGGLRVDSVQTSAQKPSNVAVYMAVSKGDEPAVGLTEQSFHVAEDGQDLAPDQTRQVLLPRDMAAVHRALLLVDMSGPVTDGDTRSSIALAVARFVTKAHASQPVSVYAFDGGAAIRPIGEYPEGSDEIGSIPALETYTSSDPSSNLHGAVIEAIAQLDAHLMSAQKPLRIGTLAIFVRGPDLAGRVTEAKMHEALRDSKDLVVAISIKDTPGFSGGSRLGRSGFFEAPSAASILDPFDRAGTRVANLVGRYYLLSYCSPARAGKRHLRVRVTSTDEQDKEISGTLSTEFDAGGFTSGCDPTARPRFVVPAEKEPASGSADKSAAKPDAGAASKGGSKSQGKPGAAPADEGEAVAPPPDKPGYAK